MGLAAVLVCGAVQAQTCIVHTKRSFMNQFSNMRGSNEEVVLSEICPVGTQVDGFAHQTHHDSHYNCIKTGDISPRGGFTKFGMDTVGTLMTRGVLIDVGGLKGVETLPDSYEITVQDLLDSLKRRNLTLAVGDAVLVHTAWGRLYGKDNARDVKSCPGIGIAAAEWLVKQAPMLIGADNWPVEVAPNPELKFSPLVHQVAPVAIR